MPEMLDPRDFIITRKRKKYRFAKFHNAANCFEFDEWPQYQVDVIEVGAGTALFLVELAARHQDMTFLALDVKADRLQKGAYRAIEQGVTNIFFVRARADQITELCERASVTDIWLTFSDPFPKRRSAGRRLTHPTFLSLYATILKPSGHLRIKHDNPTFFSWSLEQLVREGWLIDELAFDIHNAAVDEDITIPTSYEQRWLDEGRVTQYVRAIRPKNLA